jgi:hypothetical protein
VKAFALLVAVHAVQAGCSWTFVEAPPAADPLPSQPLTCTDSNFYPAADIAGSIAFGITAFSFLMASLIVTVTAEDDSESNLGARLFFAGAGTGAGSGLYLWSAIDGALDTSRCRELRMKLENGYGKPLK